MKALNEMITKEEIAALRKTQAILTKVSKGENVFFNIVHYEDQLKLVKSYKKYGTDSVGNKVVIGHGYTLTDKGKMLMNAVL